MINRKKKILEYMTDNSYKPLLFEELVIALDVPKDDINIFTNILEELIAEGKIFKTHKNRYSLPERMGLISGRIQGNEHGYAFLIPNDTSFRDIFIPGNFLNSAMHNDIVIARINKNIIEGKRAEGEVLRIITRANDTIVGKFEKSNNFGFVIPDNRKISNDIFIPKNKFNHAKNGQKVIIKITNWGVNRRNAEGEVIEILGDENQKGIEVKAVIKQFGISEAFPDDVLTEVQDIKLEIDKKTLQDRKDLRNLKMVTIDSETAKDLDDAVSIEILPDHTYRLGVHIADVTHYVKEDSPLDKEALNRGTSVYFVDRVVPMLPPELSNGICSLNPQTDRLALSVIMDIDHDGKVVKHDIFTSIININERMTYTNVTKILKEDDLELIERYRDLYEDFKHMEKLSYILNKKRTHRGAIDFNFKEAKVLIDENDKPTDVVICQRDVADSIIEEFMLVCNETVAEHFYWLNVPFVYRIHENPDNEKIEILTKFLNKLGYRLKGKNLHPKSFQNLVSKVKGTKQELLINTVVLRSLQKARYSNVNNSHFGLSAEYYCHFTSPIRRYPDLIIHRLIKKYLFGNLTSIDLDALNEELNKIAFHCSKTERNAEEAEREIEDLKKVEYMKAMEGMSFKGIISNITSFGIFVQLENTIEGMIKLSSLTDDYYIFLEEDFSLCGEVTGKTYKIGDELVVINAKSDIENRRIEFVLDKTDKKNNSAKKGARRKSGNPDNKDTTSYDQDCDQSLDQEALKSPNKNLTKDHAIRTKKKINSKGKKNAASFKEISKKPKRKNKK